MIANIAHFDNFSQTIIFLSEGAWTKCIQNAIMRDYPNHFVFVGNNMKQRFFFDIARYVGAHKTDPMVILRRAFRYIVGDVMLRQLYKYWVYIGVIFQKKVSQPIYFEGDTVFIRTQNGLYFRYTPSLGGGILGAEFGKIWEQHELKLLSKYTPYGGEFFDVGANFGWFSISLASERKVHVHAFEPNQQAFRILKNNIEKNHLESNIVPNQLAVGDRSRKVLLADVDFFGNYVIDRKECNLKTREVLMISIDEYVRRNHIKRVDSIKCDIEGAELLVLRGAQKSLQKFRPTVLVEIHEDLTQKYGYRPQEIFSLFSSMNYRYYRITEKGPREPTGNIQSELRTAHNFIFYHKK